MKQWIRWPGLVAFVVIFGGLGAFGYFFAGGLVKSTIEDQGSEALGAKVELSSVKLSLNPLGFQLNGFQAANPDKPMTNAVEFQQANTQVSFWHLLMGQVIVDDVTVANLQFNTARTTSGVYHSKKNKEEIEAEKKAAEEPSVLDEAKEALPSASEILDKETLLTETLGKEFDEQYKNDKQKLDEIRKGLPDKDKYKALEKEVKQLTSGKLKSLEDFKARKKRLSEIKKEIKNDQALLKQAKEAYSTSYKSLTAKLKEVKDAPGKDLARLKSKYSLDGGGAANVSQLLFGGKTGEWTEQALYWYEKAKPYMETSESKKEEELRTARREGRYIHFGGVEALPDFLLRKASIDVSLPAGHLDGRLSDVTHQPEILKRPARLALKGDKLKGYQSINVDAEFNHIDANNSFDKATVDIKKMQINDFSVSKDSKYQLSLKSAQSDITGDVVVKNGQVTLDGTSVFSQAQFESSAKSGTAKQIAGLLAEIHDFDVQLNASGSIDDVHLSIDSSLDQQLKKAFKGKLKEKQKELEAELKQKLNDKMMASAGDYGKELEQLRNTEGGFSAQQEKLQGMLKSEVSDYAAQQKAELAAKKKAAEEKAKKELEAKKKAEKERAKKKAKEKAKKALEGLF